MSINNYTLDFKLKVVKDIKDNYLTLSESSTKYSVVILQLKNGKKVSHFKMEFLRNNKKL